MICPFLSKEKDVNCREKDCALWCELFVGDPKEGKKEGKCSMAWNVILTIENTLAVEKSIKIMENPK